MSNNSRMFNAASMITPIPAPQQPAIMPQQQPSGPNMGFLSPNEQDAMSVGGTAAMGGFVWQGYKSHQLQKQQTDAAAAERNAASKLDNRTPQEVNRVVANSSAEKATDTAKWQDPALGMDEIPQKFTHLYTSPDLGKTGYIDVADTIKNAVTKQLKNGPDFTSESEWKDEASQLISGWKKIAVGDPSGGEFIDALSRAGLSDAITLLEL